ncbi:MAG: hypothetical protein CME70_11800 [Halobacteriovorax sp.]|nr:hypothetical protein [Halobacteriovorax sp.]|tara:strand:+ start:790 stop:2922 length:2133 start_codon:yes stop_codon:yes gene_type:complete
MRILLILSFFWSCSLFALSETDAVYKITTRDGYTYTGQLEESRNGQTWIKLENGRFPVQTQDIESKVMIKPSSAEAQRIAKRDEATAALADSLLKTKKREEKRKRQFEEKIERLARHGASRDCLQSLRTELDPFKDNSNTFEEIFCSLQKDKMRSHLKDLNKGMGTNSSNLENKKLIYSERLKEFNFKTKSSKSGLTSGFDPSVSIAGQGNILELIYKYDEKGKAKKGKIKGLEKERNPSDFKRGLFSHLNKDLACLEPGKVKESLENLLANIKKGINYYQGFRGDYCIPAEIYNGKNLSSDNSKNKAASECPSNRSEDFKEKPETYREKFAWWVSGRQEVVVIDHEHLYCSRNSCNSEDSKDKTPIPNDIPLREFAGRISQTSLDSGMLTPAIAQEELSLIQDEFANQVGEDFKTVSSLVMSMASCFDLEEAKEALKEGGKGVLKHLGGAAVDKVGTISKAGDCGKVLSDGITIFNRFKENYGGAQRQIERKAKEQGLQGEEVPKFRSNEEIMSSSGVSSEVVNWITEKADALDDHDGFSAVSFVNDAKGILVDNAKEGKQGVDLLKVDLKDPKKRKGLVQLVGGMTHFLLEKAADWDMAQRQLEIDKRKKSIASMEDLSSKLSTARDGMHKHLAKLKDAQEAVEHLMIEMNSKCNRLQSSKIIPLSLANSNLSLAKDCKLSEADRVYIKSLEQISSPEANYKLQLPFE